MAVHSELGDAELTKARQRLDAIDRDDDPLCIVISVLMLREGFDKTNICVSVVLRATEADLLLEQIVGRGVRLMFPPTKYPELIEPKREAVVALRASPGQSASLCHMNFLGKERESAVMVTPVRATDGWAQQYGRGEFRDRTAGARLSSLSARSADPHGPHATPAHMKPRT